MVSEVGQTVYIVPNLYIKKRSLKLSICIIKEQFLPLVLNVETWNVENCWHRYSVIRIKLAVTKFNWNYAKYCQVGPCKFSKLLRYFMRDSSVVCSESGSSTSCLKRRYGLWSWNVDQTMETLQCCPYPLSVQSPYTLNFNLEGQRTWNKLCGNSWFSYTLQTTHLSSISRFI